MWGAVSVMRYAYTKILIVTCYLLLQGQKCRCASVVPSLFLRSRDYRMNGLITDLERRYNGLALEEVERPRIISLKPILILVRWFWDDFRVLHRFSSMQNKVNLPEINAYCYAIETGSRLC